MSSPIDRTWYEQKTFQWLGVNFAAMLLFVCFMAFGPHTPANEEPGPGDGLYVLITIVPLLAFTLLMNFFALISAALAKSGKRLRVAGYFLGLCAAWSMIFALTIFSVRQ